MLRALTVGTLVLSACATGLGDTFFSQGRYQSAVDAYEGDLQNRPGDPELLRKRSRARHAHLRSLADRVKAYRSEGALEAAREQALELVRTFHDWGASPPEAKTLVEEQARWLREEVERSVEAELRRGAPLRALELLERATEDGELIWSKEVSSAKREEIRQVGRGRCARGKEAAEAVGPYAWRVVRRYCAAFGEQLAEGPPPEESFAKIEIDARLPGVDPEALDPLREELHRGVERTPWFDARGDRALRVVAGGELQAFHLSYVNRTVTTGGGRYTHTRTETTPVISMHRVPNESAQAPGQVVGYGARLFAEINAPFHARARVEPEPLQHGQVHNRGTLPAALRRDGRRLAKVLREALFQEWEEAFCAEGTQDPERAARCVHGSPDAPGQQAGLGRLFNDAGNDLVAPSLR